MNACLERTMGRPCARSAWVSVSSWYSISAGSGLCTSNSQCWCDVRHVLAQERDALAELIGILARFGECQDYDD
eukprot:8739110-Pyramimonas_sp.AAC.1